MRELTANEIESVNGGVSAYEIAMMVIALMGLYCWAYDQAQEEAAASAAAQAAEEQASFADAAAYGAWCNSIGGSVDANGVCWTP